ncbi:hypothetical protein [Frankia sp. AgB32]|uniref:hypothetical protein n=1 Tax=Frankia sp. AgB32 TaxID=631119 RepID=UPI00200E6D14|nr:hypothetical protein [Frankia sp. AgB32]MCK9897852.1 hypothetical protein [Frankia sp. AgB32]
MRDSQALDASRPRIGPPPRLAALLTGLALAGLVGLTAGCGPDGSDGTPTSAPSASLPSSLASALPTGLPTGLPTALPSALATSLPGVGRIDGATGADALKGTNVPADFPIPPGAKVKVGASIGSASTVTLTGVTPASTADFYRSALPSAGYKITSDAPAGATAHAIAFTGHGVTGGIGSGGFGQTNGTVIVFSKQ